MHSAQITKRLKSPRWWWWCLIISKLNISATKQKYLPCPAKVPFSLLDKLYLILLPTFQKPFRMALKKQLRENHPQTCTHCFLGTDFFSGPSPSTIINHKKYPCTHAQKQASERDWRNLSTVSARPLLQALSALFGTDPGWRGLPWWLKGKESAHSSGALGSIPGPGRPPGEGNSNPLQSLPKKRLLGCVVYSCLGNPIDRGAWQAVHGAARSQTWLSAEDWLKRGFPDGSAVKNLPEMRETWRRCGFNPWVRKSPWKRK